ncbi:MAG: hypothetical protein JW862_13955 [Anaerolineales bacterium]|nr:hypothetical protein [Anaerolineales bacterium]
MLQKSGRHKLAHALGRRDDVPNQELARELAASGDQAGIEEIVVGQRAEKIVVAIDVDHQAAFCDVIKARLQILKAPQVKRLEKLIRSLESYS